MGTVSGGECGGEERVSARDARARVESERRYMVGVEIARLPRSTPSTWQGVALIAGADSARVTGVVCGHPVVSLQLCLGCGSRKDQIICDLTPTYCMLLWLFIAG